MIINEIKGSIFDSNMHALVCPTNTVGTLGKGLALEFKRNYPSLNVPYQTACHSGMFEVYGMYVHEVPDSDRIIVCLPTKQHWRNPSKLEYVEQALFSLYRDYERRGIQSIAVPALGCGLGGLSWEDVYELIYKYLDPIDIPVEIYLP